MLPTLTASLPHTATRTITARELVPQVFPDHAVFASLPDVFATAFMVGFIEATCAELLHQHLEDGESSVGVHIDVSHIAPTPEGMDVTTEVEIVEIDRRRIRFAVTVRDAQEVISSGFHERFVIDAAAFQQKIAIKNECQPNQASENNVFYDFSRPFYLVIRAS